MASAERRTPTSIIADIEKDFEALHQKHTPNRYAEKKEIFNQKKEEALKDGIARAVIDARTKMGGTVRRLKTYK